MRMKTNTETTIAPSLAARYRETTSTVADNLAGLETFLAHRALFDAAGDSLTVESTERAWWQDAVILAVMPATTLAEASLKVAALRPALCGWTPERVDDDLRCLVAMIKAGVAVECRRWRVPAGPRPPSGAGALQRGVHNVNGCASPIIGIAVWQLTLYHALRQPLTLRAATRTVQLFSAHHAALTQAGDKAAAAGAAFHLNLALVKTGSVGAINYPALCRKATVLGAHRAVWAGDPLRAAVIEAALEADLAALKVSPHEQARVEHLLEGHER